MFSHTGFGLIAAGKVIGDIEAPDDKTLCRKVEFITTIPKKGENIIAMPFAKVSEVVGKPFFWARTIKHPYLSREEAENLAEELKKYLETNI